MRDPLTLDGVRLREIERSDLPMLRRWRNQYDVRRATREYRLLTDLNQEQWFQGLHKSPPDAIMFVIEVEDPVTSQWCSVGACGLCYIDWKNRHAELSYYVGDEGSRGHGVGGKVLSTLFQYGFGELGLHHIWGEVYEYNEAALRSDEKAGFQVEGKVRNRVFRDGKFWGSYMVGISEEEWRQRYGSG